MVDEMVDEVDHLRRERAAPVRVRRLPVTNLPRCPHGTS